MILQTVPNRPSTNPRDRVPESRRDSQDAIDDGLDAFQHHRTAPIEQVPGVLSRFPAFIHLNALVNRFDGEVTLASSELRPSLNRVERRLGKRFDLGEFALQPSDAVMDQPCDPVEDQLKRPDDFVF